MDIQHAVGVKVGLFAETLVALDAYADSSRFTAREKAAFEFAERIVRDDRDVSDECFVRLREHFSDREILELTFIVGYQIFASKFAKAFRLPSQRFASLPG